MTKTIFCLSRPSPVDPSIMVSQLGGDPATPGQVISALSNIEAAVVGSHQINQATFEIVNSKIVAAKSTTEILLSKIENVRSRLGNSSTEVGLISSPTLWGVIYELTGGMISGQVAGPRDRDVFSPEELENLQALFDRYCANHVKPLLEFSLQEYVTSSTADTHTGLLLDGADRVNDDLEHLDKRIKLLENASVERKRKSAIQTRMDRYSLGASTHSVPPNLDIPLPTILEEN